jgi:hypothetical protein
VHRQYTLPPRRLPADAGHDRERRGRGTSSRVRQGSIIQYVMHKKRSGCPAACGGLKVSTRLDKPSGVQRAHDMGHLRVTKRVPNQDDTITWSCSPII